MAVIRCKMCGGDLVLKPDSTVAECEYCGTLQTVPTVDNEKKLALFNRAHRLRGLCEFDKAATVYEQIVAEFPEEAEAYWCLVLCDYGIEYVDDPKDGKKIPTCHRSSYSSVLENKDFSLALEYADASARKLYRQEAKQIEQLRRDILEVSGKEAPYDIFICYKETDENGDRTLDSVLAQDLYNALTEQGYRVFFSRISLEDKLGQEYEPYIFAALNSARIMLAVGTDYERFHAVWVKNEWSRFLKLMEQDKHKYLIPCYRDIDAYDMPQEFTKFQAQDLGKVGAIQDLLRGIEKLLPRKKQPEVIRERVVISENTNTAPLLQRVAIFLEDRDWESADKYCERVLDMDPKNAEAYFGKLMAEFRVSRESELEAISPEALNSANYQKALRFGDEAMQQKLDDLRKDIIYHDAKILAAKKVSREQQKENLWEAISQLQTIPGWRDSGEQIELYRSTLREIEEAEEAERQERERKQQLARQQKEERQRKAQEQKQTAAFGKKLKIALPILCVVLVVAILANTVAPMLTDQPKDTDPVTGQPVEADTREPVSAEYAAAEKLLADGEIAKAAIAFGKLGDEADARERSMALWKTLPRTTFDVGRGCAIALKEDGSILVAYSPTENEETRAIQENSLEIIPEWTDVVSVCADFGVLTALKSDGTLLACGYGSTFGYVPRLVERSSEWDNISSLGGRVSVKTDGTVVGFNYSTAIEWDESDIADWTDITAVSVGNGHIVGLKSDGTVVAAGHSCCGGVDFSNWTDVVSICASDHQTVGLRSDGTVLVSGHGDARQRIAKTWTDIRSVCAGSQHTVGLMADGTVLAVGYNGNGECDVSGWTDIMGIDAGYQFTAGLRSDGTIVVAGETGNHCPDEVKQWTGIQVPGRSAEAPVGTDEQSAAYAQAEALFASGETAKAAIAFGKLGDYSDARERSFALWDEVAVRNTIAAGTYHTLGLKEDGTVLVAGQNVRHVADGKNGTEVYYMPNGNGQCDVAEWKDIIAVSAYGSCSVGLKNDGTVVGTGGLTKDNEDVWKKTSQWQDIVSVSAGQNFILGLKMDGTVEVFGNDYADTETISTWTDIVAVSTNYTHAMGLKSDGTVLLAGISENVSNWTDIVAVSTGVNCIVGLRKDGTVVAAGNNNDGQCDVSEWSDIVSICSTGWNSIGYRTYGVRADGTVVFAGNHISWYDVTPWHDIVAIAAARSHAVGLKSDGTVVTVGNSQFGKQKVEDWKDIAMPGQRKMALSKVEKWESEQQKESEAYAEAEALFANGETAKAAIAFGKLGDYSDARERSFALWREVVPNQTVGAAQLYTVGIQKDGSVITKGFQFEDWQQTKDWSVISLDTGESHILGLKSDGTVVSVGRNDNAKREVDDWSDIIAVSAARQHSVGLRSDGTAVAVGLNNDEMCNVEQWRDLVAVSAGGAHTVGLKADGTVVATGNDYYGQCHVEDWEDIVAISAGGTHTLGIKADGSVVAVGNDHAGQCDVADWNGMIAVSAGEHHSVGLKSDGTVLAVGNQVDLQSISRWSDIVAVSADNHATVGRKSNGTVVSVGNNQDGQRNVSDWKDIRLPSSVKTVKPSAVQETVSYPAYMGLEVQNVFGQEGVKVKTVDEGGVAEFAGIQSKDIITGLDDHPITDVTSLSRALEDYRAGDTATVTLVRDGEELSLEIIMDSKPDPLQ